ncbi:branched-chain amino acid ABC transporter permease [Rhizobium sp. Leaf341]|uniref:branched-chain amino acid ABC transporter permease n=1 Tax=Rhizobium sp. Leaf341 TaxID=1736344 RepID=UPI000713BCE8|nr:branched-chain amino acid ABC transporter permease [Rhizobium sp. Leaf341]KQR73346.1 branched-chain amino acid ABC transporter permease [Rhizobium sp. Leaf341]
MYPLQQLANALPVAALYAVLAFGYAIAFGVTKRVDLVYGALFAFAGQVYVLFADVGWNRLWLVLPACLALGAAASLAYTAGAGLLVGRFVLLPLLRASQNALIVAGLGVSIALMEMARLAAKTRSLWLPPFLNTPVTLWTDGTSSVDLTVIQLGNTALMLAIVGLGAAVLHFGRFGRYWRAVNDDPRAAELCGIDARRVFLWSYVVASLVAGLSGILATSYYGNMDFGAGMVFGLKVVMIAGIGGAWHPLGAAAGAALLGLAETLWSAFGPLAWRDPFVFALLVFIVVVGRREQPVP